MYSPAGERGGRARERWTYEELGAEVGMSASQAHVILARAAIKPHLTDYWMMTDCAQPEFEERLGEICGLYVDPPENVLVVSLDEKTGIQAKAPTKSDVPPRPGKPARREHEYTRNGTQCLFAALKVHHGEVTGMPSKTRNRWDLIRFLELLDEEIPVVEGQEIVAILRQPFHPRYRRGQPVARGTSTVAFSVRPKHASWLNQIEIFFSILYRRLLKHGIFTSEDDLAQQMLAYIETYNQTAKPFKWTYTGKTLEA
jgi:putative transposase